MTRMVVLVIARIQRAGFETIHGPNARWHVQSSGRGHTAMEKISLTALARQHLESARSASSGRSAHTVYGGHEHSLRQTLMAMTAGSTMDDHESPGEATLQVLQGRVRVTNS